MLRVDPTLLSYSQIIKLQGPVSVFFAKDLISVGRVTDEINRIETLDLEGPLNRFISSVVARGRST